MQYYRNKKFAAVSHRTVTRHLTWFLQTVTKYPQRKTIHGDKEPTSTLILSWTLRLPNQQNKKEKIAIGEFQQDALKLKIEMGVGEWKFIKAKKKKNKNKRQAAQQRRRVISFSPIYMSAGKWYMSFFFSSEGNERTVLFIPFGLENR